MKTFFTADCHFNHEKAIILCKRPFKDVEHMNSELTRRWNERVKPEDLVFHLGDFMFYRSNQQKFSEIHSKLNGNIIFIEGNHDYKKRNGLNTPIQNIVIRQEDKKLYLTHDPANYNLDYEYNLVGHVHGLWKIQKLSGVEHSFKLINVGVDVWNFYPVTWDEIKRSLNEKNIR